MISKHVILIGLLFVSISLTKCATFPKEQEPSQQSNLTYGVVKSQIIKGVTNQEEILKLFGAPNIITKNRENDEVWNYNKMSYKTVTGSDGATVIFWSGSRAMTSATTQSFDLIIIFDKEDIVKDYSVISAKF